MPICKLSRRWEAQSTPGHLANRIGQALPHPPGNTEVIHLTVLAAKKAKFSDEELEEFTVAIRHTIPYAHSRAKEAIFRSPKGNLFVYWSSNESDAPPQSASLLLRIPYGEPPSTHDLNNLTINSSLHEQISGISGRFSVAIIDLESETFAVATPIARLDAFYKIETTDFVCISSWARTASACLHGKENTEYSDEGLFGFLNTGHFISDHTFYKDVSSLPPLATALYNAGSLSIHSGAFNFLSRPTAPSERFFDEITEYLLAACRRIPEKGDITISLSGGKDSRLLLAAVSAAGKSVKAQTISGGATNYSDVYCASLVANACGVPHTIKDVSGSSERHQPPTHLAVDLYRRTLDTLLATDSGIISWATLSYSPDFHDEVMLNGLGGELLRGGYGKTERDLLRHKDAKSFILSRWARSKAFFRDGHFEAFEKSIDKWLSCFGRQLTLEEVADYAYLIVRTGRWASAASRSHVLSRRTIYPLLDNRLLNAAYSIPIEMRTDDRLLYNILRRLNPALAEIPFANDHWRFSSPEDQSLKRLAYPNAFIPRGTGSSPNTDWRANWKALLPEIRRQYLEHPDDGLSNLLDEEKLNPLLNDIGTSNSHRFLLFAAYAASIVRSNPSDDAIVSRSIDVPLGIKASLTAQ